MDARSAGTGAFPEAEPADAAPTRRLKRRAEFVATARGVRVHEACFTLQAARCPEGPARGPEARIGFTVTKKTGNAVERNRIRRRLREAARLGGTLSGEPRTDYVVVARREAMGVPFARLVADLAGAVRRSATKLARTKPGAAEGTPRGSAVRTRGRGAGRAAPAQS